MEAFTIEIAGLCAGVRSLFSSTREYCRHYLTTADPDFIADVTYDDLIYEQHMLDLEAVEEGLKLRKFSDPFLERASIQRKIALELLKRDTILLHGSTVGVDGYAYLFTAPCGTGKSTHTRFWRETFGDRAIMINDDKAFLKISPSGVLAYGSPWSGKHGLDTNIALPLKGICFLSRGTDNRINSATSESCIDELIHQCMLPDSLDGKEQVSSLVKMLADRVPLWNMECTKDSSAALVSYSAMSEV